MPMPTEARDVFGRPGEGVHEARLFGLAAVDVVATALAAVLVAWLIARSCSCSLRMREAWWWLVPLVLLALFVVAIAAHRALRVNTTLNVAIFGRL